MAFFDDLLVASIIGFLILLVWSRVMKQSMGDTLAEIRGFFIGWTTKTQE